MPDWVDSHFISFVSPILIEHCSVTVCPPTSSKLVQTAWWKPLPEVPYWQIALAVAREGVLLSLQTRKGEAELRTASRTPVCETFWYRDFQIVKLVICSGNPEV